MPINYTTTASGIQAPTSANTGSDLCLGIAAMAQQLSAPPAARLYDASGAQVILSGLTKTNVLLGTVDYADAGMTYTADYITVPEAGYYIANGYVVGSSFDFPNTYLAHQASGGGSELTFAETTDSSQATITGLLKAPAGERIKLQVSQNSGSGKAVSFAQLTVFLIGRN